MTKETEEIFRKYNKETAGHIEEAKRHLTVLIEDTNDGVKLIAEQHGLIIEKLDKHEVILNQHSETLEIIKID